MNRPIRLIHTLLLICLPGVLYAQTASLRFLDKVPADGILNEDRVDVSWGYLDAVPDSVALNFHDGTVLTLHGEETHYRHVYRRPGLFDLTVTCWTGGVAVTERTVAFADVAERNPPGENVMFVHHSTGRYMMRDSGVRSYIEQYNAENGTSIKLWDHDYHSGNTYTGVILPDSSVYRDWSYGVEANNIQPDGYLTIFSGSAFRDSLFARHDVIVMKNDHATGDVVSAEKMIQHMQYYVTIRDIADQYPDKLFIFMSGPPRRPEAITAEEATYARTFYDWLQGPTYMNGHPNILFFDLFDELAYPNDPEDPERNMLRWEYRLPPDGSTDSHPNLLANQTVGPVFADLLTRVLDPSGYYATSAPVETPALVALLGNVPNPFNPLTAIRFVLNADAAVSVDVYDLTGRRLKRVLGSAPMEAGTHDVLWDGTTDRGRDVASGVYLYRVVAGPETRTGRMVLAR